MTQIGVRRLYVPLVLATIACSTATEPAPAPTALTSLPRQLSPVEQTLVAGSNAFAFDLLRQINSSERDSNVFVSPLSASMALGMTSNGAAGSTYDAFHNTLRFGDAGRQNVNDGYKSLITLLTSLDPSTDFRIANSIWYERTFPVKDAFLSESKSYFNADVRPLDFAKSASVDTINAWVNDATAKKIPKILDSIDPDEVMFLINAIYFKGSWQQQFDKANTQDAPFYPLNGGSQTAPLMHRQGSIRVMRAPDLTAVDLYYGNSAFAMSILLPDSASDVNTLSQSLTGDRWKTILDSFEERPVNLYMPRFRIEWAKLLNNDLSAMGLGIAFTQSADFSQMSDEPLQISRVVQKTFVDVNEEGTEAAAVTAVGIIATSVSLPVTIRFDRPFVFAIRERFSGAILFIGKIATLPQ